MAGMESFQQSGLNNSAQSFLTRTRSKEGLQERKKPDFEGSGLTDTGIESGGEASMRENAKTREMTPLRISFISTAVAAE